MLRTISLNNLKEVHKSECPYHGADGMRPGVIPVGRDLRARSDGGGQLKSTGATTVIARKLRIGGVGDGVAKDQMDHSCQKKKKKSTASKYYLLRGPGPFDGGLADRGVVWGPEQVNLFWFWF